MSKNKTCLTALNFLTLQNGIFKNVISYIENHIQCTPKTQCTKPKLRKTQKDIYNTPSCVFSFYFFSTGSHFISLTFKSMKVYTTKTAEAAAGFT